MKRIALAALFVATGLSQAIAQDAAAGEKVFLVCKACHQVGASAKNAVGPVLNGLFGRKAGRSGAQRHFGSLLPPIPGGRFNELDYSRIAGPYERRSGYARLYPSQVYLDRDGPASV